MKPSVFANGSEETAMEELTNLSVVSKAVTWTRCEIYDAKSMKLNPLGH